MERCSFTILKIRGFVKVYIYLERKLMSLVYKLYLNEKRHLGGMLCMCRQIFGIIITCFRDDFDSMPRSLTANLKTFYKFTNNCLTANSHGYNDLCTRRVQTSHVRTDQNFGLAKGQRFEKV